jgi:acyl-coenzyme A thioesterase PaaI-like protein
MCMPIWHSEVVEVQLQNRYGTMHGGCMATLVDTVGTSALCTVVSCLWLGIRIQLTYKRGMSADSPRFALTFN